MPPDGDVPSMRAAHALVTRWQLGIAVIGGDPFTALCQDSASLGDDSTSGHEKPSEAEV